MELSCSAGRDAHMDHQQSVHIAHLAGSYWLHQQRVQIAAYAYTNNRDIVAIKPNNQNNNKTTTTNNNKHKHKPDWHPKSWSVFPQISPEGIARVPPTQPAGTSLGRRAPPGEVKKITAPRQKARRPGAATNLVAAERSTFARSNKSFPSSTTCRGRDDPMPFGDWNDHDFPAETQVQCSSCRDKISD
jgi:hypothetical protein